jgi:hypothetical protein
VILERAKRYQPDLIVWLVTLESFPYDKQLYPPLLQNNAAIVQSLITNNQLHLDPNDPQLIKPAWWENNFYSQRRALADLVRLQFYGVMWSATGIDQDIPTTFEPRAEDLSDELVFHNLQPATLNSTDLAFDILQAGVSIAGDTPLIFINEPMFVSSGQNSDIRYNAFYPRWAYDQYRPLLAATAQTQGWHYADLWDAIPLSEFTDSAVHYTPRGASLLAEKVNAAIASFIK